MSTYKIVAKTNGYIASRDAKFNGKTVVVLNENLTIDEANSELMKLLFSKYDFAEPIFDEYQYVRYCFYSQLEEIAIKLNLDVEKYYFLTQKRWLAYCKLTNHRLHKFTEPGYYSEKMLIMVIQGTNFEYDSRYYSIEEEIEEK